MEFLSSGIADPTCLEGKQMLQYGSELCKDKSVRVGNIDSGELPRLAEVASSALHLMCMPDFKDNSSTFKNCVRFV